MKTAFDSTRFPRGGAALAWCVVLALGWLLLLPAVWAQGKAAAKATPAAQPLRIVVVGDSLSAGYGLSAGEGWVDLLDRRLQAERIRAEVINASISGDTTAGGVSRLPTLLARHRPTHVIIELGGNDGLRGAPVASIRANLEQMVRQSQQAGARVLLLGMEMPPNFGPNYTRPFAQMYVDVAQQHKAALVPFFLEKIGTDLRWFQSDRIHPTAEAQPLMLDTIWPTLKPLLTAP